jgi:membrane protein
VKDLWQRLIAAPVQFTRDWLVTFVGLQGFDRAVAIAGQAFTALIPLLIVYTALVSRASGRDFADQLVEVFDLRGNSARSLREAFAPADDVEEEASAIGAIILVGSALAFTRALQRLYQLAWGQPSLGWRAAKWGLIWLALITVTLTVRPIALDAVHGVANVLLSILMSSLLWLVTPYILLARRLPWQRLLPGALLTAVGMALLGVASAVWMPRTTAESAAEYGTIGVAFSILSWLVAAALVLVVSTAGGATIDERLQQRRERSAGVTRPGEASSPRPIADLPDE